MSGARSTTSRKTPVFTTLLYPIIIVAGVLQALGPPMNAALYRALVNPWLATLGFLRC